MPKLGVYCMSYNRADKILTNNVVEYCTYVVRKSEEGKYRAAGISNLIAVEDEKIDSGIKALEWIIYNTPEDIVAILDDDIKNFVYRSKRAEPIDDPELVSMEIERLAQILYDLNLGFLTTDATPRPYGYDQPFTFNGASGAFRIFNKAIYKAKRDHNIPYNSDLDCILQELAYNRVILNPKYFCAAAQIDTNKGGMTDSKTRRAQLDSIASLQLKWGPKYFRYDFVRNTPHILVKR